MITVRATAGEAECYLTGSDGAPGVLFFMDAIGVRPQLERMADRIADLGYCVLVPNVFYRDGSAKDVAPTADLTVAANREGFMRSAMQRVGRLTPELSNADVPVWIETLLQHSSNPIAVVGYCMGVRLAMRAAALDPAHIDAVAGFHGGRLATDDPDSPHRLIAGTYAEYVFGHADKDRSMPPEAVAALDAALNQAGVTYQNEVYAGAPHGYTMADTSSYNEVGAERAFQELQALLGRTIGHAA